MAPKMKQENTSDSSEDSSSSRSTSPELSAKTKPAVEAADKKSGKSKSDKRPVEPANSSNSESEAEGSDSASGGDSDNGGATSSSESSDEEEVPASKDKSTKNVSFYPRQSFKPPSGFKPVKKAPAPSSSVSSLLSNLRGKQVFHVTAPAFLPFSKVKEISLAKVMQGEPVLTHEGVNYGIPADNLSQQEAGAKTLLLYNAKTESYYSTSARNIQSYHVQATVSLPKESRKKDEASSESVKPPKPQPKHLKMRFRPVGSVNGPPETIGTSSEESEGEEPTFKIPKGSTREREERKRKHDLTEGDGNQLGGLPRKKSRKQEAGNEPSSSQMDYTRSSQDSERGREKSRKSHKNRHETSQERRARREEKKRRKLEKAAAAAA